MYVAGICIAHLDFLPVSLLHWQVVGIQWVLADPPLPRPASYGTPKPLRTTEANKSHRRRKTVGKPPLCYHNDLHSPAPWFSLKQSNKHSEKRIFLFLKAIPTNHSSYQHILNYIPKQHAFLHCCGMKQLPMLFSPCYPTEGYPLSTEANKSALET